MLHSTGQFIKVLSLQASIYADVAISGVFFILSYEIAASLLTATPRNDDDLASTQQSHYYPSICGGVSKVWNGGGEVSVHSNVSAPSPQGLFGQSLPYFSV